MQADKTTNRITNLSRRELGGAVVGKGHRHNMRAVVIAILLIATAWLCHPYLTRASEGQTPPATEPSFAEGLSAIIPAMHEPAPATQPEFDATFTQIHGHANFWRLVQDQAGVWWFCSPANHLEFLNTVTTVQPYQFSRDKDGAHYVSRDWAGDKPDINSWADATLKRVNEMGFKGLGAWCNPAFHQLNIPMTQDLNVWAWIDDASKRFYTPDWSAMADQAIKAQVTPLADNKNLVGYFIDNELDWGDGFAGPGTYFDHLPVNDPNRKQVLQVMREEWPKIEDFNLAWDTKVADWDDVVEWTALPRDARGYTRLSSAWQGHLARDYFKTTTALIHKYDPNHLILGVRFKGYAPQEVVSASKGLTDAQSLNYYVGDARLDGEMFRMMNMNSGQPIVISEYSFHSLDGRSGDQDVVGFSAQVPDQQARADGYRLMTTRLARVPYIVGADWFQWCDEPAGGRSSDGEDVNFGVVDIHDTPYDLLVDAVKQTSPKLNPLHAVSAKDGDEDVWRDSYANKPVMHVPFLAVAPKLDGEFSQWAPAAKLSDLRRDQTIGLDRSKVGSPNVYMGWTKDGIYMGVEVFDGRIVAAPARGWWWTRDHVEWWISTRPVASDQTGYDVNCQQYFFVPQLGAKTGPEGVVGQWHRDGDAIKDNLIPHPDIKSVVKILPDRYEVEMFIPAAAMHGFDPEHQPALAFNIHVRDFESAADFFWSAPKAAQTQFRPNTWGQLYLDAPGEAQPIHASVN